MIPYQKLAIYYFSGTGNSRNVTKWLSEVASKYNIESLITNIVDTDRLSIALPPPDSLVAFVSPIHGFNYPPVMLNFIIRFPKGKNNVLLMNTRAGMLLGKFIIPGITGIAFYFSALILKLKGYSIKAMYPVDLPSNWTSIHPGLNERTVKYLHEKNKEMVTVFADKVFSGKSDFRSLNEILQDAIFAPISIGYYFIGRYLFAKSNYASGDCNNCDICIKGCPVKAIKIIDNRPFWTFNCESCMKCMCNCPKKAIETAHGFLIEYILGFSFILIGMFYKYFELLFFKIESGIFKFIVGTFLFLTLLGLRYRIIHYLMRFRFIERLMVYTSLTKFKFWGQRYKALKNY